jgi:protein gp37
MAFVSGIEWTEATWNPVTGCSKMSLGCKNCYAERIALRLQSMGQRNYRNGFKVTIHEHVLDLPLRWKRPKMIFVNSMSDLFHRDVPDSFIMKIFSVMEKASWHTFQVLTKRSGRLAIMSRKLRWPSNIWMGVTVEKEDYFRRIEDLKKTGAYIKFLSLEPLLGPMANLDLTGIDWIIVGGESGPGARIMRKEWVLGIRDKCAAAEVPFFFKQWGGTNKKKAGRLLEYRIWDEMPRSSQQDQRLILDRACSR